MGKGDIASKIRTLNPFTEDLVKCFDEARPEEVEEKLRRAQAAFGSFRKTSFPERSEWLGNAATILISRRDELARTMTIEMGKPIRAAIQEVEKCAAGCRYYARNAPRFLAEEDVNLSGLGTRASIKYQPIGPVLAIMPWNFPFWQVFRFAAPALMAGNVGLLKHASNVPQCALAIEDTFRAAGFPEAGFQTLLIGSEKVEEVIADRRVAAVTLTGSVKAGQSVASAAGKQIKKSVLELGGSDPFIVMPSADLDSAAKTAITARTINNGQSCIAAKRFIIHEHVFESFARLFVDGMKELKMGDPLNESTDIGPLATREVLQDLERQVQETLQMGARALLGGARPNRKGFFFSPTVITDIPARSPGYCEELFGPVALLFKVKNLEAAIQLANDSNFGLGSCIWTNDRFEEERFVGEIQAGLAFINGMVASQPELPFGGVKQSGYGRELSWHGMREFVNVKTVVRATSTHPKAQTE